MSGNAGVLLALTGAALACSGPVFALQAGAARVSITPPLDMGHVSLGGYGARMGKPYEGVHDDIYARALFLSQGDIRVAVVTLDLLMVPPGLHDDVAAGAERLGLDLEHLIITASHTHCAPENTVPGGDVFPLAFGKFNEPLYNWTVEQILAVLQAAHAAARPALLGAAQSRPEGMNRNRRGQEVVDPDLTVVRVDDQDGQPVALLVNYTAHPTILSAETMLISGEWPGVLEQALEEQLGSGAVALYCNGAEGDLTTAGVAGEGFERADNYGRRLAELVLGLTAEAQMQAQPTLKVVSASLELPERVVSPAFVAAAGREYPVPEESLQAVAEALFPGKARVHVARLGDALAITIPGEAICEIGIALKDAARQQGAKAPFIAGLANTYCGYILTPEEYMKTEDNYESGVSFYGPQFGPFLLNQFIPLIEEALR